MEIDNLIQNLSILSQHTDNGLPLWKLFETKEYAAIRKGQVIEWAPFYNVLNQEPRCGMECVLQNKIY